jgi:ADP-heptose:LPS heptosyltransferase
VLAAFGVDPEREGHRRVPARASTEAEASAAPPTNRDWGIWQPELFLTRDELDAGEARWRAAAGQGGDVGAAGGRLLANVSAGAGWRYWPDERFIAALGRFRARFPGWSVMLVGAPEDGERMARIGEASGATVTHTAHYRDMMALVAASDVVLTADTSVTHIASALRKPAVVMFARARAGLYGPYGTAGRVVSITDLSLDTLEVEPVVDALEAVAAATRTAR